jgi:hypothetical protein
VQAVLRIRDVYPGSEFFSSRILIFFPFGISNPGVIKAPDPETGSATLDARKMINSFGPYLVPYKLYAVLLEPLLPDRILQFPKSLESNSNFSPIM